MSSLPAHVALPRLVTVLAAAAIVSSASCWGGVSPDAAPVVHLPLDGDLRDRGTLGLAPSPVGDEVSFGPGVEGEAVFISGTEDWVEAPFESLDLTGGATLELWVRRDDWANPYGAGAGGQTLVTFDPITVELSVMSASDPDRNRIRGRLTTADEDWLSVTSDVALPPLEWTHLAFVYDAAASRATLWVNGEAVASEPVDGSISTRIVNPMKIGTWYRANQAFRGWIDEVRLHDHALSAEQIADALGTAE